VIDRIRAGVVERWGALLREPTDAEVAAVTGIDEADVASLRPEIGPLPFSPVPTEFVAVINGRRHFGRSFGDALEIVARLGGIGRAEQGDLRVECTIRRVSAPRDYVVAGGRLYATAEDAPANSEPVTVAEAWRLARLSLQ
jgi:hypothetical protein